MPHFLRQHPVRRLHHSRIGALRTPASPKAHTSPAPYPTPAEYARLHAKRRRRIIRLTLRTSRCPSFSNSSMRANQLRIVVRVTQTAQRDHRSSTWRDRSRQAHRTSRTAPSIHASAFFSATLRKRPDMHPLRPMHRSGRMQERDSASQPAASYPTSSADWHACVRPQTSSSIPWSGGSFLNGFFAYAIESGTTIARDHAEIS